MIRNILTIFCMIALSAITAVASSDTKGKRFYYDVFSFTVTSEEDATVELTDFQIFDSSGCSITIPPCVTDKDTGKEYTVTSIGSRILAGWNDKKTVERFMFATIPSTVTTIKDEAFYCCTALRKVIFGGSETHIGNRAFYNCTDLEECNLPNSLVEIGKQAFFNCSALELLTLPESLIEIDDEAFAECTSLGCVIIPDSVKKIGEMAFFNCINCYTVVIGKSVTKIGNTAFCKDTGADSLAAAYFSILYSFKNYPPKIQNESGREIDTYVLSSRLEHYQEWNVWPFNVHPMPDAFNVFYKEKYTIKEGEEVKLMYQSFNPGDVEIVDLHWEAFNPRAVEVSQDGVAKGLKGGEMTTITLTTTDSNGNQSNAKCRIEVLNASDVETITPDTNYLTEVFSINGLKVAESTDNLSPGIYIVKTGATTKKIAVK